MSFWTYIPRCSDGTYYTGHTDDRDSRVAEHQSGAFAGSTHDRRPVDLMCSKSFRTRLGALDRERQIKDWSRRKKKKKALSRSDGNGSADAARSRPRVSTSPDTRSNQRRNL